MNSQYENKSEFFRPISVHNYLRMKYWEKKKHIKLYLNWTKQKQNHWTEKQINKIKVFFLSVFYIMNPPQSIVSFEIYHYLSKNQYHVKYQRTNHQIWSNLGNRYPMWLYYLRQLSSILHYRRFYPNMLNIYLCFNKLKTIHTNIYRYKKNYIIMKQMKKNEFKGKKKT